MSNVRKCERCGISNNEYVRITAICKQCGKSFLICNKCQPTWKSQKCPSCGGWISSGTWNFVDMKESGGSLSNSGNSATFVNRKKYVEQWNAIKADVDAEREKDGPNKFRNLELDSKEVSFLRNLEDLIHECISIELDENKSYIIAENGHIVILRLLNIEIGDQMPESISDLSKLKELRLERTDKYKEKVKRLPESITKCSELETVILRSCDSKINVGVLASLPNLKRLSVQGTYRGDRDDSVSQVFTITQLEELNLRACTINNTAILEGLGNLKKLKKINLSWMKYDSSSFSDLPSSLQNLKELEEIDANGTMIGEQYGGPWPNWMTTLPNLKVVHFKYRQLKKNPGPFLKMIEKKDPTVYDVPDCTDDMYRKYDATDWDNWFDKNKSDILKAGWSGVQ